jgi:hypothetical protein
MVRSPDESPEDDYFNDLSRQPARLTDEADQQQSGVGQDNNNSQAQKPKRIACVLCRKRKLKCDGTKPSCSTCVRLQHDCSYDEVRRKSGPKRGYVKALEARLAQVETLLKGSDESPGEENVPKQADKNNGPTKSIPQRDAAAQEIGGDIVIGASNVDVMPHIERALRQHDGPAQAQFPHAALNATSNGDVNVPQEEQFPWEMIGLGLDEPLPPQDAIDELTQAFFDKIHPSVPMMHRPRFYAAMHLAPHARPPICLRYAMWANAAAVTDKYEGLQEHFYQRSRKYIQQDEMRGHGESMVTISHAQTWILLATYEFKMMFFPRAWMSSGRASRMTQMMGLHRLDGNALDVKQCLPPPRDGTEREERRRTFWMSFCVDRYSSIGTGWPMAIEERDILTNMPVDEASFETGKPQETVSLSEALEPSGANTLSSYGGVILMASLFGRNLTHLHRPGPDDRDGDLNGEFWKRHRSMDNILSHTALGLPDELRLPTGLNNPNVVFLNMNIHTSTICLHQAAIFKADKNRMPARLSAESKVRCITAAAEIASIMRTISHLDLAAMNPFISFCLYVAARVFVQYLKSRPKDNQVRTSLQFLLSAMHAIKRRNRLTESFLVQLDVDLEAAGLEDARMLRQSMPKPPATADRAHGCANMGLNASDPASTRTHYAYGDSGLAAYNHPDPRQMPMIPVTAGISEPYEFSNQPTSDSSFPNFTPNDHNQFDVTTREQRTPGSLHTISDSNQYRSPSNLTTDMDTSPDGSGSGSGGGGQQTPSSQQNNSSRTSNTAYSPPNAQNISQLHQQQQPPQELPQQSQFYTNNNAATNNPQFFNPNDPAFTTSTVHSFDTSYLAAAANSFDLSQQQHPQQSLDYTQSQIWEMSNGGGGTGLTPGDPGGADIMNMSDVDWNQMMEGLGDWNQQILLGNEDGVVGGMAEVGRG